MEFLVYEVALWQAHCSCFCFPLPVIIQWMFPYIVDTSVASQARHVMWPLWRNFKPSPSTRGRSNFMANSDYRRKKKIPMPNWDCLPCAYLSQTNTTPFAIFCYWMSKVTFLDGLHCTLLPLPATGFKWCFNKTWGRNIKIVIAIP